MKIVLLSLDRAVRVCRVVLFVASLLVFLPVRSTDAADRGTIPENVQKALTAVLASQAPVTVAPDAESLAVLLDYATSPLSASPDGSEVYPAPRAREGQGIYWRMTISDVPLAVAVRYLFTPQLPQEAVYPASIRRQKWLPDSDILTLPTGLWEQLGKHRDVPLVLRGSEEEEITPDTFSGCYYKYVSDRMLILAEFEGRQVLVTVTWQKGRSEVGKKAAHIGPYENWDFVYSGAPGTLAGGIGWADTYMYASCAIMVLYEDEPGGKHTRLSLFKWLNAGWAGMNMVQRRHILDGAVRSFGGLTDFLSSPRRPSAESLIRYVEALRSLSLDALRERFAPYAAKVSEAAADTPDLRSDDFRKVIKDASYGLHLDKDELISALVVNHLKALLGKPQLVSTQ